MNKNEEPAASAPLASLLERWSHGDRDALNLLLSQLYRDVHAIAVRQLRDERHLTLQPTALVHEVYLRLASLSRVKLQDRAHFLSMAARVTRQALVDEARRRRAAKRDGGDRVTLTDSNLGAEGRVYDALDVDELLQELERIDKLAAEIVTLRVFGGLSIEEVAESLSVSVATVNRRWASGKAWLTWELQNL
jgi:RNA polymerase sigma factor (TIGR02999 family)